MSEATHKAGDLLALALGTYRDEIRPAVPKDRRYAAAMVANALGMAQRRLSEPDPDARLAETLGVDSAAEAAQAIRRGAISDASHPDLAGILLDHARDELRITNPRFLERRESQTR